MSLSYTYCCLTALTLLVCQQEQHPYHIQPLSSGVLAALGDLTAALQVLRLSHCHHQHIKELIKLISSVLLTKHSVSHSFGIQSCPELQFANWRALWKNRISSTSMKLRKSLVKPVTWQNISSCSVLSPEIVMHDALNVIHHHHHLEFV